MRQAALCNLTYRSPHRIQTGVAAERCEGILLSAHVAALYWNNSFGTIRFGKLRRIGPYEVSADRIGNRLGAIGPLTIFYDRMGKTV